MKVKVVSPIFQQLEMARKQKKKVDKLKMETSYERGKTICRLGTILFQIKSPHRNLTAALFLTNTNNNSFRGEVNIFFIRF